MRIVNPATGRAYVEKRRQRFNEPGQPRALTFSCYRRLPFLMLPRLRVREGKRLRHRVWQPGGGYDRNITTAAALRAEIDYLHGNPVQRGLVAKAEDWEWSSARWFAGIRPVKIEMDDMVLQ
jgi:hypothetical protein